MARQAARPEPTATHHLQPIHSDCPACGRRLWADYRNRRTVATLDGLVGLILDIRRCHNPACPRRLRPYRPEAEPHFALPYHEFGLDVMALVGRLRHAEHRSIPEIHRELTGRGLVVAQRTVTNLLDRYDELRALATADPERLTRLLRELDSDKFAIRAKAAEALAALGDQAHARIVETLTGPGGSLEYRRRLEQLRDQLAIPSGDKLRALRAIEVLEHISTPEAGKLLEDISKGASTSRLTWDAESARAHLAKRLSTTEKR